MKRLWYIIADYLRETDKLFMIICLFTSLFGCAAVLSTTRFTGSSRQFLTQLVGTLLGLAAAIFISNLDFVTITRHWYVAALIGLVPVILTFFIGVAPEGTDDRAWLILPGGLSFQPAELLKIAFIVTFSAHLGKVADEVNKLKKLIPLCIHGAIPVVLIHFQGDDGTALVFALMFVCMLVSAGLSWKYVVSALGAAVVAAPIVYFFVMNSDQKKRLQVIFDLESDLLGAGYQQWRGRAALASGGIFGQGYMKGELTGLGSNGVPEGYNDFIFTCIGEELGMLGCLAVVILLATICLRALRNAKICKNPIGKYICVGFFGMVAAQTIINIGMCVSILPVIGITLPFFSAGGTSLCCLYFGVGLVMSAYLHRDSRIVYLRS